MARPLSLKGIHHITLLVSDAGRSSSFYRGLLGMRVVKQTANADDPGAVHLFFGDDAGNPGTLVTCLEYPSLPEGQVGVGSTHHFALGVESDAELEAWRKHLEAGGVSCTEILDRRYFRSFYVRDPDGHIVELATLGPGLAIDEPEGELGLRYVEP